MRKIIFSVSFILFALSSVAKHVTGGEMIYDYISTNGTNKTYSVTLRLFRDGQNCTSATNCADLPSSIVIGVYNNDNSLLVNYITVNQSNFIAPLTILSSPSCITNIPIFKYEAAFYSTNIDLPNNAKGYTVSYQTCCRIATIDNGGSNQGATYAAVIPGNNQLPNGITDNSPRFETGISIICFNQPFVLVFSATDPDGDQLEYSLVNAYNGGEATNSGYTTPSAPPYSPITYNSGYSGEQSLGPLATITPNGINGGKITGIAPSAGKYVVCVAVKSYRNGVFIAEHRKDFIITVAPCELVAAELKPVYTFCDFGVGNQLTYNFANESSSILNITTNWNFGDPTTGANNTSSSVLATHTYSSPGDYILTLIVNKDSSCERTATSIVKVYPGFFPNIAPIEPQCRNVPLAFVENGTTNFGVINFWKWDFGITTLTNDTSRLQIASYSYPDAGMYTTTLIVKNSKGCIDTLTVPVTITENANLIISRDTLICAVDTLQLSSNFTNGTITWSPNYNISNVNSFNPLVSPDVTTTYTASYLSPSGCSAIKTVTIKVVNEVTLLALTDTTICRTDTARINTNTDALYFSWTPTNVIVNPTVRNPLVFPTAPSTIFRVKASISNKCFKEADVRVITVPYPVANITGISTICYGDNSQLNATGGSTYLWSPSTFLNNANIPNPISIKPTTSITYKVQVNDNLGCPKPVFKTFSITVVKLSVDAGPADTSIVLDQPLQLNATTVSGTIFNWTPSTDLSSTSILNPISSTRNDIVYKITASNNIGCTASDSIRVKVYNLPPDIYIPSAFSPDKDGINDVIRPIALGIKRLENFSVYNRFGELLFKTSDIGKGWDGTYKGEKQLPGTYVWQAMAIDYKDKKIFRKGSVILIR